MVEFGLKLQDNEVSEWSEHYIAYERLKALLKRVKAAHTRYEENAKKKPALAAEIKSNYKKGIDLYVTSIPPTPTGNLGNIVESLSSGNLEEQASGTGLWEKDKIAHEEEEEVEEKAALIEKSNSADALPYYDSQSEEQKSSPSSSSHGILTKAVTSVSGYFEKRYETALRDNLKEMDRLQNEFDNSMIEQVEKVNNFYDRKVEEIEKRLSLLTENVVSSLREKHQAAERSKVPEHIAEADETALLESTPLQTGSSAAHGKEHDKKPSMDWRDFVARLRRKSSSSDDEKDPKFSQSLLDVDALDGDTELHHGDSKLVKQIAEADSIQRALVDQYRTAKLLHNFAIMNYTGFVKIAKKHDKMLPNRKGHFNELLKGSKICNEGLAVEKLAARLERKYANWFCDGNLREAYAQLLPKRGDGLETDWSQLRLGYRMGMCAVLGVWVCWDCIWGLVARDESTIGGRTAFPVFRACGGLLLLQWFWACSVFVWTRFRVNYIYLFDFDPRIVNSPLALFSEAVDNTLFFLVCMLLYYKSGAHDIPEVVPAGTFPLVLVLYTLVQLVFPLRTRVPMWKEILKVVTAPAHSPSFYHGYIGDIFTSMVKVFQDIAWTICFLATGDWKISEDTEESTRHEWSHAFWYKNVLIPIICLFPLVIRFNQCLRKFTDTGQRFPHLANAFKYAMSQTVTLFGAFHPLYLMHKNANHQHVNWFQIFWMAIFVCSSVYSFTWDVLMDWGLGRPKYNFLGPRLMYPKRTLYFYIIGLDLVLRFMWVLTLLPPQSGAKFEVPNYLTAMVMTLELFRRTIWGFLRLENEHRSNTAGFRRVSFVPLHFNTGHNHKYKQEREHKGISVLAEVAAVATVVLIVCVYSVVAAEHATRGYSSEL